MAEIKVVTPGKIVPYKCCLPSSGISMMKDFHTDDLKNKAILGKMGGVYGT